MGVDGACGCGLFSKPSQNMPLACSKLPHSHCSHLRPHHVYSHFSTPMSHFCQPNKNRMALGTDSNVHELLLSLVERLGHEQETEWLDSLVQEMVGVVDQLLGQTVSLFSCCLCFLVQLSSASLSAVIARQGGGTPD